MTANALRFDYDEAVAGRRVYRDTLRILVDLGVDVNRANDFIWRQSVDLGKVKRIYEHLSNDVPLEWALAYEGEEL